MENKSILYLEYETKKVYFLYQYDSDLILKDQLNLENITYIKMYNTTIKYSMLSYFKSLLYGNSKNIIILTLRDRLDMFDLHNFLKNLIDISNRVFVIKLFHKHEDSDSLLGDIDYVSGLMYDAKKYIDSSKLTIFTTSSTFLNEKQLNFVKNTIDTL